MSLLLHNLLLVQRHLLLSRIYWSCNLFYLTKKQSDNRVANSLKMKMFPGFMSCLEHSAQLCKCQLANKMILYRFNNEELENILSSLKRRRDRWKEWLRETEAVILGISRKTFKPGSLLIAASYDVLWCKNLLD